MVCQKSRDRQSVRRASSDEKGLGVNKRLSASEEQSDSGGTCHASSVSADERSVCSNGSSSASHIQCSDKQSSHSVSIISAIQQNCGGQLPFISNDPVFVARILQERNRNEIMKAAKAMLYDAFLKANKSETA
jgi:hypothetical protein